MARQQQRVHVGPYDFSNGAATDYWIQFNGVANQTAAAAATNPGGLSGWLFTTTSLVPTSGTAGDFNSSTDFTPSHSLTDGTADIFATPRIFGGYDQMQRVKDVLGYAPTELVVDQYAAFTVASANEVSTYFGLINSTGAADGAGSGGCILSDGTNFRLVSDLGNDAGALIDNGWHLWRILYGSTNTEWFDDIATPGTLASRGTITTEADIWPLAYVFRASTTNRVGVSWLHIFYR